MHLDITSTLQRSRKLYLFVFIILVSIHIAPTVAEDNSTSMSNNLLADLAPILALFGDQVTKQYLSRSTTFLDCVVFSLCPIGIITAVVSAIRVAAPNIWKSVIGRAMESPAMAELELLSSASDEVCELWSGQAIVRVMGSPEILEVIFIKELEGETSCGLYTLSEANGTQLELKWKSGDPNIFASIISGKYGIGLPYIFSSHNLVIGLTRILLGDLVIGFTRILPRGFATRFIGMRYLATFFDIFFLGKALLSSFPSQNVSKLTRL